MTSGSIPHGACSRTIGHALLSYPAAHGAGAHFLGLSGHSAEHPAIWVSSSCLLKNSLFALFCMAGSPGSSKVGLALGVDGRGCRNAHHLRSRGEGHPEADSPSLPRLTQELGNPGGA